MKQLPGILKIFTGLAVDFTVIFLLTDNLTVASIITGLIALYVWLGGYIALLREGAISLKKLPAYTAGRLEMPKTQLIADVKADSGINLSNLKLFLIPGESDMNATAYGAGCVSVTQGTLNNTDPITLTAVLTHEASHLIHLDPEFNRLVFASVTLIMASLSLLSAAVAIAIFLIFLILNCFRSRIGVLAFQGTTRVSKGFFSILQRCIVTVYRAAIGLISRRAEYRCDFYSLKLGYGTQLAHFLSMAEASDIRVLTIADAIYRSHPPTYKRIAQLEKYTDNELT